MSCEICTSDSPADSVMWKCAGCSRQFHAVCIGVSAPAPGLRGSLRSTVVLKRQNDKAVNILSYMLPCCSSCQDVITADIEMQRVSAADFKTVIEQQKSLEQQLHANTEVIHRLALMQEQPNTIIEAIEGFEKSLSSVQESVSSVNNNTSAKLENAVCTLSRGLEDSSLNKSDEVVGIKNHLTSLFNISMEATRKRIEDHVRDLTDDLSRELVKICNEVKNLSSLTVDMAAQCNEKYYDPANIVTEVKSIADTVGEGILSEIKSIADIINTMDARSPPEESPPSLLVELNSTNNNPTADSGWRVLGTRKVWKADWADYDARKSRRLSQQKLAEKARKRRKQNRARQNFYNNHSLNRTKNNSRNNDDNFNGNNINHTTYNRNTNNWNNKNNNKDQSNHNILSTQNANYLLPPDRELLAAAKDRFSRPPASYRPTIQFRRGEILNPYPANVDFELSDSTHPLNRTTPSSCAACSCRHSCFQRT